MHSKFTVRNFIGFLGLMLMVFMSCTRVPSTELGAGLIPTIDGVITKDTLLEVITDTYMDKDSVRVYENDNHVLGAITNDPLFGKTAATMCTRKAGRQWTEGAGRHPPSPRAI